jgi:hypothetical protein
MNESNAKPSVQSNRPIFIVRLWWESGAEGEDQPGEWRGSVELLASGQRQFFRRLSDIGDIIAAQLENFKSTQSQLKSGEL